MKKIILFLGILAAGLSVIFFLGRDVMDNFRMSAPTVSPTMTVRSGIDNLIRLEKPEPGQLISSPLTVKGEARGYWYFEASFPVRIYDADGVELGVIPAQAQDEWMTDEFVPFEAVLRFKKPATEAGTLVLQKDNPSGLPENDAELRIPIRFDPANLPAGEAGWSSDSASGSGGCKITGCSGQVCAEEDVITSCEFKSEYACYKNAKCGRQEDGKCGWVPTEELVTCLGAAFQAESGSQ
ncbi:MAG: hypothetical protein HYT62_01865 [Candidatus Yanofskybacteria bacterium]|nr:hypothetical protein [Candidatus Yanofskybacteria bacterium]